MAISIAGVRHDDSPYDSESNLSADSDDSGQHNGSDHPRVSKISAIFNHVSEQIGLLYNMSMLLKRPGVSGKYLRSTKTHKQESKLAHFSEFDYEYIREKFHQWGRLEVISDDTEEESDTKKACDVEAETSTTIEDIQKRKEVEASASNTIEIMCRRLGKANTRRREQLRYWCDHPDQADTIRALNLTAEIAPETEHITIYAETTVGNHQSNRVPNVPKETFSDTTFKCPYCQQELQSSTMMDRLNWKRHVFRDLRPYVCTFPNCLNPDKLYLTRHDWIYHEQQMHRRKWVCARNCDQHFPTKELMVQHLYQDHSNFLSPQEMDLVIAVSERPIDETEIQPCLFCPAELSLGKLQTHTAEHLETIALFVLPTGADEDVGSESNKGVRDDENSTRGMLSSVEFSRNDENEESHEANGVEDFERRDSQYTSIHEDDGSATSNHNRRNSQDARIGGLSVHSLAPGSPGDGTATFTIVSASGYPPSSDVYVLIRQLTPKDKVVGKTKHLTSPTGRPIIFDESFRLTCTPDSQFRIEVKDHHTFSSDEYIGEALYFVDESGRGDMEVKAGMGTVVLRSSFVETGASRDKENTSRPSTSSGFRSSLLSKVVPRRVPGSTDLLRDPRLR
ncbi:hypothetical protein DL768_000789 [Monosporascus sp. mg162]|nr:hypothetical protein DL768_000789 [Monosporascus sp. mg162]